MEAPKGNGSRVHLLLAALLVGAFVGTNCNVTVDNRSDNLVFEIFELTTPASVALNATYRALFAVTSPPNGTASYPETLIIFKYTTPPNSTQNITGVREEFLTLTLFDKAFVTLTESNATYGKVGFTLDYPAAT